MYLNFFRHIDLSFPTVIFRRFDLSFSSVTFICRILSLYSVILLCHSLFCHIYCHLPTSSHYVVSFCRVPQSFASVIFTWHFEPVIYNPLSLHSVIILHHYLGMCFCSLHLAFDMSICNFACVLLFCHVLLSFVCCVPCRFPLLVHVSAC